jgi:tetratricopeptide (TPR) repeat protein
LTFNNCLLPRQAFDTFTKIIEIEEKTRIGEYLRLSEANVFLSLSLVSRGNPKRALKYGLNALELSKKTDSVQTHGMVYSILAVVYTRLEDLTHAEEYFNKLMQLPPEILNQTFVSAINARSVFFAGKNQWEESNRCYKEFFKWLEINPAPAGLAAGREMYSWALERQGRHGEAKAQLEEAQKIRQEAKKSFEHVNLKAHMTAKTRITLGQTFEARLDIVNVSEAIGSLVCIKNFLDPKLDIVTFPQGFTIQNNAIQLNKEALQPFQVRTIKFSLQAKQLGNVKLNPEVTYIDDCGKTTVCIANRLTITVQAPTASEEEKVSKFPQIEFAFKSVNSQKAYNFLIKAFVEDYVKRRMPIDRSGWRSLMELVKYGKISKYSVYGFQGHGRQTISELERRGLVEARVFSGERGRGGNILKLRINHKNEALKGKLVAEK